MDIAILRGQVVELGTTINKVLSRHDSEIEDLRREIKIVFLALIGCCAALLIFAAIGAK